MVRSGYGAEMAHSCFDHRLHPGYRNGRVEPDSIGRLDEFDICGKLVDERSRSRQRVLEYSDRGRSNSDIGIVHGCHCFVEQHHTRNDDRPSGAIHSDDSSPFGDRATHDPGWGFDRTDNCRSAYCRSAFDSAGGSDAGNRRATSVLVVSGLRAEVVQCVAIP